MRKIEKEVKRYRSNRSMAGKRAMTKITKGRGEEEMDKFWKREQRKERA